MFISLRSASLFCAALCASSIAPAQVDSSVEPLLPVESASLPKIVVPELLDPAAEPTLSEPSSEEAALPSTDPQTEQPAEHKPAVDRNADLASQVAALRSSEPGSRELECLAVGIYFESKSEPLAGQLAVGHVIANRANSGRFPSSYCGVLFQRSQFSFIRSRSWPPVKRLSRQWQNAVAVAKIVDQELHASPVGKALFFHARHVSPRWRLKRVAAIGNHIFYR